MFWIKDANATIWSNEPQEKYAKVRLSTSDKDQQGNWHNSNWFASFIGKAKDKVAGLPEKTRIKILNGKVSNELYEKDGQKKSSLKVVVIDFEVVNSQEEKFKQAEKESQKDEQDDQLPF